MNKKLVVVVQRIWEDFNQTTGMLYVVDENDNCQPVYASVCIERGDRNNEKNVSNIPPGEYPLLYEFSNKFERKLWEIKNVPNRSECKIHAANEWDDLNGCIAPGSYLGKLNNKDGYFDILSSGPALDRFHKAMKPMQNRGTKIIVVDPIDIF